MTKKIIGIVLTIIILSISISTLAVTQDELTQQRNEVQNKINEAEGKIGNIKTKVDQALVEIDSITSEIMEKQDAIDKITYELNQLNEEIEKLSKELKIEEQKYDEQYEALKSRMVAQYKIGNTSYLDVLLNSKSLSDFISRYYIIEKVAEYDSKLLTQIEEQKTKIEEAKKIVETKQQEASDKNAKLKLEELALKNKKINKNKMVEQLTDEQKQLQNEIEKNTAERERLDNEIRELARQQSNVTSGGHIYTGGQLQWPCPNYTRISSEYGYRGLAATGGVGTAYHRGLDMASAKGTPVLAAESGTVIKTYTGCPHNYGSKCGCGGTLGNYILISHGGGLTTLYGHNTSVLVSVGQTVTRGQQIATVGSTGNSTGYHLHFSVLVNGSYVNPNPYLGR